MPWAPELSGTPSRSTATCPAEPPRTVAVLKAPSPPYWVTWTLVASPITSESVSSARPASPSESSVTKAVGSLRRAADGRSRSTRTSGSR